jgi:hypothetical protein
MKNPIVTVLLLWLLVCCFEGRINARTLQAQLDAGKNITLRSWQVVEITESLKLPKASQRVETVGARTALEYARIVHTQGSQGTLIEAKGIAAASLTKLVLNGNQTGARHPEGLLGTEPMLSLGGEVGKGQEVRNYHINGAAAGYGYVANGLDGFEILGNTSDATCSGLGEDCPANSPMFRWHLCIIRLQLGPAAFRMNLFE